MKRIILHWTAGTYVPNEVDLKHYHFLVDSQGKIYKGRYEPNDNLNCNDNYYAAHTGGGNTGSIGVALCGMYGFISRTKIGKYPIQRVQCEAAYQLCAKLCKIYALNISPITVTTHYEFGKNNPKTTSFGKQDINFLPYQPDLLPDEIADYIRGKVRWYFNRL